MKTKEYKRGYDCAKEALSRDFKAITLLNEAKNSLTNDDFDKGWKKCCEDNLKEGAMTLTDYQKRDAHIVRYLEEMIAKLEKSVWMSDGEQGRRKAYKDILFKMTKTKEV